jgi:hypothetical protein
MDITNEMAANKDYSPSLAIIFLHKCRPQRNYDNTKGMMVKH